MYALLEVVKNLVVDTNKNEIFESDRRLTSAFGASDRGTFSITSR